MKVTFTRTFTVEAPEGATHYTGDLLEEAQAQDPNNEGQTYRVTWWKYVENETGTFKGWCWYRRQPDRTKNLDAGWYIHGETAPTWGLQPIPKEN